LTEENDWVNMGTYNYGPTDFHFFLDMNPYKKFGNSGRDEAEQLYSYIFDLMDQVQGVVANHPVYQEWENNSNAVNKYNHYKGEIE
jgi:hypothetical protein